MIPRFPRRFLSLVAAVLAVGFARAGEAGPIVPQGGNTYSITVKANNKFTRNTDKLKDEAMAAATDFCTKAGKQLKVVSATEDKSLYLVGPYAQVVLTFKALSPGDPELAPPGTPAPAPSLTTDELYASLMKLDELHKKGILTDAEFEAEKKKVLARSK